MLSDSLEAAWGDIEGFGYDMPDPAEAGYNDGRFSAIVAHEFDVCGLFKRSGAGLAIPGMIWIANDLNTGGPTVIKSLQGTTAHELYHLVTYPYAGLKKKDCLSDGVRFRLWYYESGHGWWVEDTGDWVMNEIYPNHYGYIDGIHDYYDQPHRSYTRLLYQAVFPRFLEEHRGAPYSQPRDIIRAIWEALDGQPGDPVPAVDQTLRAQGSSLSSTWANFGLANYLHDDNYYGYQDGTRTQPVPWPNIKVEREHQHQPSLLANPDAVGAGWIEPLGASYVEVLRDGNYTYPPGTILNVNFSGLYGDDAEGLPVRLLEFTPPTGGCAEPALLPDQRCVTVITPTLERPSPFLKLRFTEAITNFGTAYDKVAMIVNNADLYSPRFPFYPPKYFNYRLELTHPNPAPAHRKVRTTEPGWWVPLG